MTTKKHLSKEERLAETDEQRRQRYTQSRREIEKAARAQRKKEQEENTLQNRRLSFLTNLIYAYGYNYSQIAKLVGTTEQAMSWFFSVKDDCRLSQAEVFLEAIGLELGVSIVGKKPINLDKQLNGEISGVKYTIEGDILSSMKKIHPKMPDYVNNSTPGDRMYFLAQYLPTVGLPITELANRCDMDLSSLRYIFLKDDIKISRIYAIAKATGGEIVWRINEKK